MSSEQVIAVPEVFRERLAGGWSFAYQPGTNYVGLNHPQGGKQSVLRIEYGAYADEIGSALAAFLNLSTPANMVTVPASELRAMREEIEQLQARNAEQAAMLGACYVKAGADTDGDPPERHASDALRAVTDLRNDYDEACEELHGTNGWKPRAEAAESKLCALLDGIEAAPVLCHRLHTGNGKWCWVDGPPNAQCLEDAQTFGWELELATDLKALREKANG